MGLRTELEQSTGAYSEWSTTQNTPHPPSPGLFTAYTTYSQEVLIHKRYIKDPLDTALIYSYIELRIFHIHVQQIIFPPQFHTPHTVPESPTLRLE